MTTDLHGRSAIVTGGATLVGQGVVRALHAAGARVVIADIDVAGGAAIATELGDGVVFRATDITSDDELAALATEVGQRHGGIDVLVNLACTYLDDGFATSRADWLTALDVNLVSAVAAVRAVHPWLVRGDAAAVVNWAAGGGYSAMGPEQAVPAIPQLSS